MAIATAADVQTALRQYVTFRKGSASGTAFWRSFLTVSGEPGAGSFAVGNTANGLVPTDTLAGVPALHFASGNGYISALEVAATSAGRFMLIDRVFHCGSYNFDANTTLASQPSYSGRIPNGDYSGTQIFFEQATNATGIQNVTVTYTDQDGNLAATTGAVAGTNNQSAGSTVPMPFAAGDSGVQKIESVVGSVASGGTFNVIVGRILAHFSVRETTSINHVRNFEQLAMPEIFPTSCLQPLHYSISTAMYLDFTIISK